MGIYCRNGANRSPLAAVCYVIAATGCTRQEAIGHVSGLRKLTDLREAAHGFKIAPLDFLKRVEPDLQALFPKSVPGLRHSRLPETAHADDFKT